MKNNRLLVSLAFLLLIAPGEHVAAQTVFEADFNGSGTGTGERSNLVTLGGTAVLYSVSPTAASVSTSPAFISGDTGGYLHINSTGNGKAGITISAAAAHSPDVWFAPPQGAGTFDTVNGGLDFFFSDSGGSAGWTSDALDFRPVDISGGSGGLRITLNATAANQLSFSFSAKNSAGTTVQSASAVASTVSVVAGALYHIAVTLSTNATSGVVTAQLFLAPGNTPIKTASSNYLIASSSTAGSIPATGTNAVTHAFNCTSSWWFGAEYGNSPVAKTMNFDSFRVYGAVPAVFNAVTYLPDLAAVAKPNPEPALPGGSDLFSPPVTPGGAPVANTPAIAEYTRTGTAGDYLAVTGNRLSNSLTAPDLGKDTSFLVFGENTAALASSPGAVGQFSNASANGGYTASVALGLDPGLPAATGAEYGAMYFVWPGNSSGYGAPVAVNRTEAWWVGPDNPTAGASVTLFGRNLSHDGGTSSANIYFKAQGGSSGQYLTPTAVNPYAVTVTIPTGTATGTYELWAHNGHGEHYGWSGPTLVSVVTPVPWTSTQFNVKSAPYSAVGDGVADDTAAINRAVNAAAASPYSTIYFPAGKYKISGPLGLPQQNNNVLSNVQWVGVSQSTTTIQAVGANYTMIPVGGTNITLSNLTLDANTATSNGYSFWLLHGYGPVVSNFHVNNCTFLARGTPIGTQNEQQMIYLPGGDHKFFSNCTFEGASFDMNDETQLFFDHCTFAGMYDSVLVNDGSCSEMSMTNCLGEDYDWFIDPDQAHHSAFVNTPESGSGTTETGGGYYTDDPAYTAANPSPANASGWSIGLLFKGLNGGHARGNLYWGNNQTANLGVRIGNDGGNNNNWGEQIGFEQNNGQFLGTPMSATSTSVTFSSLSAMTNPTSSVQAVVLNGTGLGQIRDVASVNVSSGVVTLASGESWAVPPDTTSTVALGWYVNQVAVYGDNQGGKTGRQSFGAKGVDAYGGAMNLVVDHNTFSGMEEGIFNYSMGQRSAGSYTSCEPVYFLYCANNSFVDCETALYHDGGSFSGALQALYGLGNVYIHNTITRDASAYDPGLSAMQIYTTTGPGTSALVDLDIYDQNTITNTAKVFYLNPDTASGSTGHVFIGDNAVTLGTAAASGSYGVEFVAGSPIAVSNNQWSGFASPFPYSGTLPGAELGLPERVFTEVATAGGAAVTDVVTVWNTGTASESWTASSDSSWLKVSPASGTVANEDLAGPTTITCNPAGLTAGSTYTGTITLTCGSQSQKLSVIFTVLAMAQSYPNWQSTHFTTAEVTAGLAAQNYDAQGDGVPNLVKYALGIDPKNGTGGSLPVGTYSAADRAMQFAFVRDKARADIDYVVASSADLIQWTPIASSTAGMPSANLGGAFNVTENLVAGTSQVNVMVEGGQSSGNSNRQFLRLQVVLN